MFNLTGKNALVTGASGGLGGEIARQLHAAGAKVVLAGTRVEPLNALKAELGDNSFVVTGNLSDPAVPASIIKDAEAQLGGGVDILVNNAGLTRDGLAVRMKDEDWDAVLNVNLSAAFRLTRACLKGMMTRRWGRIVNITSIVGVTGNGGQVNYAASKAGLIGMTKSLAQEMAARNVTVNCVAPGFIVTAMTDALTEDQRNKMLENIPAGYLGEPKDIASATLYLSSEEARYVTGQTLHVNGGMAMI
ncbi:MAG: 3-oxoacyl-[acyl-carrier-protein] reductase [Alphaproteobacteria bacterium]|nr:3-oxoacyl-[acyl-carrier-protein] reductase [Alphaproteobacteria bacterium]MBV8548686.1 3-oxoacyl-[acyl-carrier-protein] reductase [Alphaproteobacteria bacterium]